MPVFKIEALDAKGLRLEQRLEADSAHEAIRKLQDQGVFVYSAEREDAGLSWSSAPRPLTAEDLSLLSEQLSLLTAGGMPLAPALSELAREAGGARLSSVIEDAKRVVEQGGSLEEAFSTQPGALPPIYLSLLRVGERTGNLPAILLQLSDYTARLARLRYQLQSVLAYPIVLLVFLTLFFAVFSSGVLVQFEQIFAALGGTLPFPTRVALAAGDVIQALWLPLTIAAAAVLAALVLIPRLPVARERLDGVADAIRMYLPFYGPMYRAAIASRFFRSLGLLLGNGAPIVESLHLAGLATGSARFSAASMTMAAKVAQGETLGNALESSGLVRHSLCWMLRQGEAAGASVPTLMRLADSCDFETERRERNTLTVLGPGLIILLGLGVAFVVISLFMPVLQLSSLVY